MESVGAGARRDERPHNVLSESAARAADRAARALDQWLTARPGRLEELQDYYRELLATSRLLQLQDYELEAAAYLIGTFDPSATRIVEAGPGVGLLSGVLAGAGFEVVSIEYDNARYEGLKVVAEAVNHLPSAGTLVPVSGWFPSCLAPFMITSGKRNVLLMTNVVSSRVTSQQNNILHAAVRFDDLIMDLGRFGIKRKGAPQKTLREQLGQYFVERGIVWNSGSHLLIHYGVPAILTSSPPPPELAEEKRVADLIEAKAAAALTAVLNQQRDVIVRIGSGHGGLCCTFASSRFSVLPWQRTVGFVSDIVEAFSGRNQDRILRALLSFDLAVLDISRFGVRRELAAEKHEFFGMLTAKYFEPGSLLYRQDSREYWMLKPRSIVAVP
jgi:hypothetical protein